MSSRFGWFPAQARAAGHVPLFHGGYAECHTLRVVARDGGFRPAVPLPAIAIVMRRPLALRRPWNPWHERVAALGKPLSFTAEVVRRTITGNRSFQAAIGLTTCPRHHLMNTNQSRALS